MFESKVHQDCTKCRTKIVQMQCCLLWDFIIWSLKPLAHLTASFYLSERCCDAKTTIKVHRA